MGFLSFFNSAPKPKVEEEVKAETGPVLDAQDTEMNKELNKMGSYEDTKRWSDVDQLQQAIDEDVELKRVNDEMHDVIKNTEKNISDQTE